MHYSQPVNLTASWTLRKHLFFIMQVCMYVHALSHDYMTDVTIRKFQKKKLWVGMSADPPRWLEINLTEWPRARARARLGTQND